jgi:hypothetical protein
VLKHFSLGPVLSPRLDAANATEPLERSRWQYGVVAAAKAFEQPRRDGASQVFLASGIGVVAGVALTGLPLFAQFLIGGVAGLAVYWGVPTAWAGVSGYVLPESSVTKPANTPALWKRMIATTRSGRGGARLRKTLGERRLNSHAQFPSGIRRRWWFRPTKTRASGRGQKNSISAAAAAEGHCA